MNRLSFFQWLLKGAAAVFAAPLARYLPKATPKTISITPEDISGEYDYEPPGDTEPIAYKYHQYKDRQYTDTWLVGATTIFAGTDGEWHKLNSQTGKISPLACTFTLEELFNE